MRIDEVIAAVKGYCLGISPWTGEQIDEATTRDKVTYGTTEKECTGVVTCIWPTVDIVRQAMRCDANLIISHEALFWNHGDVLMLTGVGNAFPFMRVHTLLEALQPYFSDIPILVMYPGSFDGHYLRLFDRLEPNDYYRAFSIIAE